MSAADVDRLRSIAAQLAGRVRDETPEDNARWLTEQLPDGDDWFRLCFVLAAAVPDDQPYRVLTAWTYAKRDPYEGLSPCGTRAAAERHIVRGEPVDEACMEARRKYQRDAARKARVRRPAA